MLPCFVAENQKEDYRKEEVLSFFARVSRVRGRKTGREEK